MAATSKTRTEADLGLNRRSFFHQASLSAFAAALAPSRVLAAMTAGQAGFAVRALELCGSSLWQWRTIDRSLDLMERLGLNTLILGQDDLPNSIVWPRAVFSEDFMFDRDPTHMTVSHTGCDYLRQVIRRAGRKNITVFLEAKEISYPYLLVERHPELMVTPGIVCPTHPLWWDFERARYQEIVDLVPDIGGVVVSAGTTESEVTFAARACTCERCRSYSPATWHENLVRALHQAVRGKGRRVVVRDFSYSRAEQDAIIEGCSRVSPEIVLSLKSTPQDFCPVFPDNPRIGDTPGNPAWIEYDTMGQFSGQGVFPVGLVDDLQGRLGRARAAGIRGVTFRADLEAVSDSTVFNSPNLFNLCAGALLAGSVGRLPSEIVAPSLAVGIADPLRTESEDGGPAGLEGAEAERFARFMEASWSVMAKTTYVRGLVFTDGGGQPPDSVDAAFDHLLRRHGRDDWEPGASGRVAPTADNLRLILAEKAEAEQQAAGLADILQLDRSTLPADLRASLEAMLGLYRLYVQGFRRAAAACFTARLAQATRRAPDIAVAQAAALELDAQAEAAAAALAKTDPAHFVRRLLDPAPARRLAADVREQLAELAWEAASTAHG
jgi:hypothetical protein